METIQLGLIGSDGRMGTALKDYLAGCQEVSLIAQLEVGSGIDKFLTVRPDVAVDLSLGHAVEINGPKVVRAGIPYIVGATGITGETIELLRTESGKSGSPVLIVPNFSIGANLMIKFSEAMARHMKYPVITERHHAGKADAPSGTAIYTAGRIAEAGEGLEGCVQMSTTAGFKESVPGVLGGAVNGIPVHSIRGDGYLAEQEVRMTLPGETLVIEHQSIDRRCFMPGILYAIRNIGRVSGLVIGLDSLLEV